MRPGPSERLFGSLRFRLAFWNTVGLLVICGGALVGIREGLWLTLSRKLNGITLEDADALTYATRRYLPDERALGEMLNRKAKIDGDRHWFGQVLAPDGRLIGQSDTTPPLNWPTAVPSDPLDIGQFRVLQRTIEWSHNSPVIIRVGSHLSFITDDVDEVTRVIVLAGVAILVVAPAVGYWLAGRATRPLQTIIDTTAGLRPGTLAERLPLRGTNDELDQLSATINGFLDRIAEHLSQQREFVANAAHELRSPLAALRTSVEVALQRDRPVEEYQDLLCDVVEQAGALGGLVNQLLLLAEGDAERLRPGQGSVRLTELAERAVDMFQGVAEQREIALAFVRADPVTVPGDASHLRQVIHNLLDNAIKFTTAGGRVEVESGPGAAGRAELRVRDTGVGIAPADLPHVFDRFFRADRSRSREKEAPGTGLGLSICHAIVTAYGGRLSIQSTPGKGTTVTADLPRAR
jgi:signal transduction histidine kinase